MKKRPLDKKAETSLQKQFRFIKAMVGKLKQNNIQEAVQTIRDHYQSMASNSTLEDLQWVDQLQKDSEHANILLNICDINTETFFEEQKIKLKIQAPEDTAYKG